MNTSSGRYLLVKINNLINFWSVVCILLKVVLVFKFFFSVGMTLKGRSLAQLLDIWFRVQNRNFPQRKNLRGKKLKMCGIQQQ